MQEEHLLPNNKRGLISYRQKRNVWIFVIILCAFIRVSIVDRIPSYVLGNLKHDDAWVVWGAKHILDGQWLGSYNQYTLIKGPFAPLLLAFSRILGITNMHMNTILYVVACIVFIKALSPIFCNRKARFFCFIILLFNPVSYALMTWQRVYRNGLSQWQLLLIFGSTISIYQYRDKNWKKLLPWSILNGISLWSFVNTREDSVWIYPFVITGIIITIYAIWKQNKKRQWKHFFLIILPIIIVISGNLSISFLNYSFYGGFLRNDRTEGNFANVVRDLYMIEPDANDKDRFSTEDYKDQYLNIYSSTIRRAYEISPTLATASESINEAIKTWDSGEIVVDGEAYLDHVLFALRDGVAQSGHYKSLSETENFYKMVHQELQEGFRDGRIKKRNAISVSSGSAAIEWSDIIPTLQEMLLTIRHAIQFEMVSTMPVIAEGSMEQIVMFEDITGDKTIFPDRIAINPEGVHLVGWAFADDGDVELKILIRSQNGKIICEAQKTESIDVYQYFASIGNENNNAKKARFSIDLTELESISGLYLSFIDQMGIIHYELPLASIPSQDGGSLQGIHYNIEEFNGYQNISKLELDLAGKDTSKMNHIRDCYQFLSLPLAIIAFCTYILISIYLIIYRKNLQGRIMTCWLLETGIILSYMLFSAMMSLMTVTTFNARIYLYLSPMYVLQLAFYGISIPLAIEIISGIIVERRIVK